MTELEQLQNSGSDADTDVDGYGCGNVEVYQPTNTCISIDVVAYLCSSFLILDLLY